MYNKKLKIIRNTLLGIIPLLIVTLGITYAFFNYSSISNSNIVQFGDVYFNTSDTTFSLTNAFPISSSEVSTSSDVGTITVTIQGNTTYSDGVEYLVKAVDMGSDVVSSMSIVVSGSNVGTQKTTEEYYHQRGGNTSIYTGYTSINSEGYLAAGYIASGGSGINGTITIKAYLDINKIIITDTASNANSSITNGKRVYTTGEWNNLSNNTFSFKVNVEANEGTWVTPKMENVNIMGTFPTAITNQKANIKEIYFISDTQNNINTNYAAATTKADVSLNQDGSILAYLSGNKLYVASTGRIYLSTGYDLFYYFTTNGVGYIEKIDFTNVDTILVITMQYMFYDCNGLTSLDLSNFDTSSATSMRSMFYGCSGLTSLNVSNFDTSNVTTMRAMFYQCSGLTSLDLSNFDTSSVTSMQNMFYGCSGLISLNVSSFDTSNVTSMYAMFDNCSGLTSLNVSNFNTSSVTAMQGMFENCSGLTSLNVSNFGTSNVISMEAMFYQCSGLTSLNVSNFDTSNVTSMRAMFYQCSGLTSLDLSNFDTSSVTNMKHMFFKCTSLLNLDLSNFNTSSVTEMLAMFAWCSGLTSLNVSNFDTSNVSNMISMFYGCSSLTVLDLSSFDTGNVISVSEPSTTFEGFYSIFKDCTSLVTIYVSNLWDVSAITDSTDMFANCTSLVGGANTHYNASYVDKTYARIDNPSNSEPGYLTYKAY